MNIKLFLKKRNFNCNSIKRFIITIFIYKNELKISDMLNYKNKSLRVRYQPNSNIKIEIEGLKYTSNISIKNQKHNRIQHKYNISASIVYPGSEKSLKEFMRMKPEKNVNRNPSEETLTRMYHEYFVGANNMRPLKNISDSCNIKRRSSSPIDENVFLSSQKFCDIYKYLEPPSSDDHYILNTKNL